MMGEHEAFLEVYHRYSGIVYRSMMARTRNHCLAEDFCQQIFLKYFENRKIVRKGEELAWLLAVGKRLTIDFYRKPSNKKEILMEDETWEPVSVQEDPSVSYEHREFLERMMMALYEKNQDWFDAMYLTVFLQIPEKTAAEQLSISIDLLRTRLYRGRNYLKELFKEEWASLKSADRRSKVY